jgi:hypothetical protein
LNRSGLSGRDKSNHEQIVSHLLNPRLKNSDSIELREKPALVKQKDEESLVPISINTEK